MEAICLFCFVLFLDNLDQSHYPMIGPHKICLIINNISFQPPLRREMVLLLMYGGFSPSFNTLTLMYMLTRILLWMTSGQQHQDLQQKTTASLTYLFSLFSHMVEAMMSFLV